MKRLALLATAAVLLTATQVQAPAEAKSLRSMLDSAANKLSGRSDFYNQFRNPYFGYGYPYGFNNGYGYGWGNQYNRFNRYYGYRGYNWY